MFKTLFVLKCQKHFYVDTTSNANQLVLSGLKQIASNTKLKRKSLENKIFNTRFETGKQQAREKEKRWRRGARKKRGNYSFQRVYVPAAFVHGSSLSCVAWHSSSALPVALGREASGHSRVGPVLDETACSTLPRKSGPRFSSRSSCTHAHARVVQIHTDSYFARGAHAHAAFTYVRATPVTGDVFVYSWAH